jgi:signal transduction histidine kinase
VEICLAQTAETLQLTVNDDGVGFETTILSQTQALGVASMRERVNLLQGEFLIESEVGRGTRITILLPLGLPDPPEPQAESLLGEPESRQTPSQTEVAPS